MPDGIAEQDVAKLLGELFRSVSDLRLFAKKLVRFKWGEQIEPSINFDRAPVAVRVHFAEQLAAQGALTAEHIGDLIAVLLEERPGQRARIGEVLGSASPAPAAPAQPAAAVGAGRGAAPAGRPRARKSSGGAAAVSAAAPNGAGADGAGDLQNNAPDVKYDIFFAHASPDKALARDVVGQLTAAGLRVFFDEDLRDGDWDQVIPAALRASSMVACLCSGVYPKARYFREEVQIAVKLNLHDSARWRLRPIGVSGFPGPTGHWPYGLGVMNAIICGEGQGAAWIAGELLKDFGVPAPQGAGGGQKVNPGPALGADSVQPVDEAGAEQGAYRSERRAALVSILQSHSALLIRLSKELSLPAQDSAVQVASTLLKLNILAALRKLVSAKAALGAEAPPDSVWGALAGALCPGATGSADRRAALVELLTKGGGSLDWAGRAVMVGLEHAAHHQAVPAVVYGGRDRRKEPLVSRLIVWDDPAEAPFFRRRATDEVVATEVLADVANQALKPELTAFERGDFGRLFTDGIVEARTSALKDMQAALGAYFRYETAETAYPQYIVVVYPPDPRTGFSGSQFWQRVKEALEPLGSSAPPVVLLPETNDDAEDLCFVLKKLIGTTEN